jgi:hypothetical protein
MSRRLSVLLVSTWLTMPAVASAEDLSPEKLARIRRDEKAAMEQVNVKHGGKKSSEMDAAERRQVIQEQQDAIQGVMEQHGVSRKDYARQTARLGPQQNAQVDAAEKSLAEEEKARQQQAPAPLAPEDIPIQLGWGEDNPVTMDEMEGAPPVVEYGVPVEGMAPPEGAKAPSDLAGQPAGAPTPAE